MVNYVKRVNYLKLKGGPASKQRYKCSTWPIQHTEIFCCCKMTSPWGCRERKFNTADIRSA